MKDDSTVVICQLGPEASCRKLFPRDAAGSAFNGLISGFKYQKMPAQPTALARQMLLELIHSQVWNKNAESLSHPPSWTLDPHMCVHIRVRAARCSRIDGYTVAI